VLQPQGAARTRGEAVLMQQIEATRAPRFFIPGNHDWGNSPFQRIVRGGGLARNVREP
jgi:hypothetical protein